MYFLFSKAGNFETSITRVPYNNKLLTNLACSSRTGEYWPSVVSVRTSLRSVRTATSSGQYSPVRPSRSVSKRLIFLNFQNRACCEKDLKDNKHNRLHLGRNYARIFVLGHYMFLDAQFSSSYGLGKLFASRNRLCPPSNILAYFRAKWRLLFI